MMVFIHGFTGAPASWDGVCAELARARRIHRVRVLGHDGGPLTPAPGGFAGEVDRIAAELHSAGMRGVHLVGYSLGGRLALGLLASHPELLTRVTLIGARNGLASEAERHARRAADQRWLTLLARGLPDFVEAWETQPLFGRWRSRDRAIRLAHDPRGLALALSTLGLAEMPRFAISADLPVALVTGADDLKFAALARELAAGLPRATLHSIDRAGHNIPSEAPAALAALLTRLEDDHV